MDRPLERKTSTTRRLVLATIAVAALFGGWKFYGGLMPSVDAADVVIAQVSRGTMRAELAATGRIVPVRTELVTSPIESRVLTALVEPGAPVRAGEELMRLDTQQIDLDLQTLRDRTSLAANDTRGVEMEWQERARDLDSQIAVAGVDLEAAETRERKYHQLFETRTVSEMDVREAEVAVKRARIQLQQLRKNREQLDLTMAARVDSKRLKEKIRGQELQQLEKRRERAAVRAPVDGVVLDIVDEPGRRVAIGDELVTVADLSRYRVEATLSEFYAERLQPGDDATVRVGEVTQAGTVSRVRPGVDGGNVRLDIALSRPDDAALKPNRRADVRILAGGSEDTLIVEQAGFARGGAEQDVFVVDDSGVARKQRVNLGLNGVDRIEILSGVTAGDRMIVSDTREFDHLNRLRVRQP